MSDLEDYEPAGQQILERAEIQIEEAQIEVLATVDEITGAAWPEAGP